MSRMPRLATKPKPKANVDSSADTYLAFEPESEGIMEDMYVGPEQVIYENNVPEPQVKPKDRHSWEREPFKGPHEQEIYQNVDTSQDDYVVPEHEETIQDEYTVPNHPLERTQDPYQNVNFRYQNKPKPSTTTSNLSPPAWKPKITPGKSSTLTNQNTDVTSQPGGNMVKKLKDALEQREAEQKKQHYEEKPTKPGGLYDNKKELPLKDDEVYEVEEIEKKTTKKKSGDENLMRLQNMSVKKQNEYVDSNKSPLPTDEDELSPYSDANMDLLKAANQKPAKQENKMATDPEGLKLPTAKTTNKRNLRCLCISLVICVFIILGLTSAFVGFVVSNKNTDNHADDPNSTIPENLKYSEFKYKQVSLALRAKGKWLVKFFGSPRRTYETSEKVCNYWHKNSTLLQKTHTIIVNETISKLYGWCSNHTGVPRFWYKESEKLPEQQMKARINYDVMTTASPIMMSQSTNDSSITVQSEVAKCPSSIGPIPCMEKACFVCVLNPSDITGL